MSIMQWMKRSAASFLGPHKDKFKQLPLVKQLNQRANQELDLGRQALLKEYFDQILSIVYDPKYLTFDLWLDFGSLLGYYREGGRIDHDIDMDFALKVDDYESFLVYEAYLISHGFAKRKVFRYDGQIVEMAYDYRGLNIDFIFYQTKGDQWESVTIEFKINGFGKPTRLNSYRYGVPVSQLVEGRIGARRIVVPHNCQAYLGQLYGPDFMEPTTHYQWQDNPIYRPITSDLAEVVLLS